MTYEELMNKYSDYKNIGIRFENLKRSVGDIVYGASKRLVDDREFPSYESEDYEGLEDMEGISSWALISNYRESDMFGEIDPGDISAKYAYILTSDYDLADESCDDGEAVYDRPEILEVIEL